MHVKSNNIITFNIGNPSMKYLFASLLFLSTSCTPFIFKIAEGGFDLEGESIPLEHVVDYNYSVPHDQYLVHILIMDC